MIKTSAKYIEAIGRRKTSVARVRVFPGSSGIEINGLSLRDYFKQSFLEDTVMAALKDAPKVGVTVKVTGGGISSQAEAVRHGLATAISKYEPELRKPLKKLGFLKRDSRMKERRKFGLKKARKAAQWSKR